MYLVSLCLLGFAFREDDLVDEEEDHHGNAAVEHGGANVIDKVRHQQACNGHPHTVDGVDNAGDQAERHKIPCDLLGQVALAAEHKVALDGEVDAFAHYHGYHVSAEIRQAAMGRVVTKDVPLKGFPKQCDRNARPAKVYNRQAAECHGQKLQQQIFEYRDQV